MTRNQKIALGCGGAGCLGLIVVAIAVGVGIYFYQQSTPGRYANINYNSNRNSNFNINSETNENSNDDSTNSSSNSSSSGSADSLSEDERHRLYHAATMTGDPEVIRRVSVKLGLTDEDFTQSDKYTQFVGEHVGWAVRNYRWIADNLNTQEKARAYINEHLP